MVRPKKPPPKKQQRGSIDFKKIKRKVGRKLPPPSNATNTEIKSKSIVLPEQSIASDRTGLAVSSKGLTLRELLQQSSHHNVKFRRSALTGIKDLLLKNQSELKLVIIEKLRERVCDNDKVVRDAFYQLLRSIIFAPPKEATIQREGQFIFEDSERRIYTVANDSSTSLLMPYVFNAMTHLVLDIRLTGFKFLDLIVTNYPSTIFLHAEKVIDHYRDILQNRQIYLHESSKLKTTLEGLANCLSLLASNEEKSVSYDGQETVMQGSLHGFELEPLKRHRMMPSASEKLEELVPVLVNSFKELAPTISEMAAVDAQSFDSMCNVLQCIKMVVVFLMKEEKQSRLSILMSDRGYCLDRIFAVLKRFWDHFPVTTHQRTEKEEDRCYILNIRVTEIFLLFTEVVENDFRMNKFLEFLESSLFGQFYNTRQSTMAQNKYLVTLLPSIPRLICQVTEDWKTRLLKAFTHIFQECEIESKLNLACLYVIEILLHGEDLLQFDAFDKDILICQSSWLQKLPQSLLQLKDTNPSLSKVILNLILRIGQCSLPNSFLDFEINNLQFAIRDFYCVCLDGGNVSFGPFLKLPIDCQELSICSLYYFSNLNSELLQSLAYCCICCELEPSVGLRTIDVLQSSYKVGHVDITDYISFLVTVVARFDVRNEHVLVEGHRSKISNLRTFQLISKAILSSIVELGDRVMVLKLLQKRILLEMSIKPSVENMHSMLRMIAVLDSKLLSFSEEETYMLSQFLFSYLIDIAMLMPAINDEVLASWGYHMKPCIYMFHGSEKLVSCILQFLNATLLERNSQFACKTKVNVVVLILVTMFRDVGVRQNVLLRKCSIHNALRSILTLLSSAEINLTLEERQNVRVAFDTLKIEARKANSLEADELQFLELS